MEGESVLTSSKYYAYFQLHNFIERAYAMFISDEKFAWQKPNHRACSLLYGVVCHDRDSSKGCSMHDSSTMRVGAGLAATP